MNTDTPKARFFNDVDQQELLAKEIRKQFSIRSPCLERVDLGHAADETDILVQGWIARCRPRYAGRRSSDCRVFKHEP
jgi:hypothetical protein